MNDDRRPFAGRSSGARPTACSRPRARRRRTRGDRRRPPRIEKRCCDVSRLRRRGARPTPRVERPVPDPDRARRRRRPLPSGRLRLPSSGAGSGRRPRSRDGSIREQRRRVAVRHPDRALADREPAGLDSEAERRDLLARRRIDPRQLARRRDAPQRARCRRRPEPCRVRATARTSSPLAAETKTLESGSARACAPLGSALREAARLPRPRQPASTSAPAPASARRRSSRRRRAREVERRILAQDRLLELAERLARLDAELLDEPLARVRVDAQRLRLPPRAVEREHELPAQPLAQRVPRRQCLELRRRAGRGGRARARRRSAPRSRRAAAPRAAPPRRARSPRTRDRRAPAAPERERGLERPQRLGRLAGGIRASPVLEQPLEPMRVDLLGLDLEDVAAAPRDAAARPASNAFRSRETWTSRLCSAVPGRPVGPERLDQPVARDDLVRRAAGAARAARAASRRPSGSERSSRTRFDRPEQPELHGLLRLVADDASTGPRGRREQFERSP